MVDFRGYPSETSCTLTIIGEPGEVERAAVQHAIDEHGVPDSDQLRTGIRESMKEATDLHVATGGFVQLVDLQTARYEDGEAILKKYRDESAPDEIKVRWSMTAQDHEHPDSYLAIVGFDSYEDAMANSQNPRTHAMSAELEQLVSRSTTFRNLDVIDTES